MRWMRKLLTLDQLLEAMNNKLVIYGTCSDCRFSSIVPLEVADESGCNWSHANLNCMGYPAGLGQSSERCSPNAVCQPQAARVIAEAKQLYNVR
jgi:hypothetical protein